MKDYAKIDNELAAAQLAIGESSNIAQQCLTYTYNPMKDVPKYVFEDYVCILSVLAQCAIDNAKRKFDIDLPAEISRIKADLKEKGCKYPKFWIQVKKRNDKRFSKKEKSEEEWNKFYDKFSSELKCPMNYIGDVKIKDKIYSPSIETKEFLQEYTPPKSGTRLRNKKVESLISEYSIDLFLYNRGREKEHETWLLLNDRLENIIEDIREISAKDGLYQLMLWLMRRALGYGNNKVITNLNKNRSLLMKTLYDLDKKIFLSCFKTVEEMECAKNIDTSTKMNDE